MQVHGMAEVDALMHVTTPTGMWQGKPCYQTAAVLPEYPDAPTLFTNGSYVSAAGYTHFRETLGLTNKYWIRFGYVASNSAGVAIGTADVEISFSHARCGSQLGFTHVVINAGMISGTDINYFEIGTFTPTVGFDKVMAALVLMDNESTYLECQLVCRTAKDVRAPNAWQTCEASWDNPAAGNSARNTTALTPPAGANLSTNFLVQFGRSRALAALPPRARAAPGALCRGRGTPGDGSRSRAPPLGARGRCAVRPLLSHCCDRPIYACPGNEANADLCDDNQQGTVFGLVSGFKDWSPKGLVGPKLSEPALQTSLDWLRQDGDD